MKRTLVNTQIALLFMSGAMLILVGTYITVLPTAFYSSNNIEVATNVSLLNEFRAPAGLLQAAAIFMISALFVRSNTTVALWLATIIYLSYALSRIVSMTVDVIRASGLVMATALDATVGLACLLVHLISRTTAGRVA